jgi:hypothetical protein
MAALVSSPPENATPTRSPEGKDCRMLLTTKDCHMEIPRRTPNCCDKICVDKRLQAKSIGGIMRNQFSKTIVLVAIVIVALSGVAVAQPPAPPAPGAPGAPAAAGSSAIANPNYVSVVMEANVNKPAAEVWARVGKYCDIGEWLRVACTIVSGKDGEVGTVRSIGTEILVGKTELSYTYTQPVRAGQPYIQYHGTLEARPVTATTSKIVYTLMWDNSPLADDAAKEADKTRRRTQFQTAVDNMKILAEGGTLPPVAARGGGGGGAGRGGAPGGAPPAGGRGQ